VFGGFRQDPGREVKVLTPAAISCSICHCKGVKVKLARVNKRGSAERPERQVKRRQPLMYF